MIWGSMFQSIALVLKMRSRFESMFQSIALELKMPLMIAKMLRLMLVSTSH